MFETTLKAGVLSVFLLIASICVSCIEPLPTEEEFQETQIIIPPSIENSQEKKQKIDVNLLKIQEIEKYKSSKEKTATSEIYFEIIKQADNFSINPNVIISLIIQESNFYTKAVSHKNCRGLGQISKAVLDDFNSKYLWKKERKTYTFEDMFDYKKNIEVACWYISFLYNNANVLNISESDFLYAYNVGPKNVSLYKEKENYNYVKNILNYYDIFQGLENLA